MEPKDNRLPAPPLVPGAVGRTATGHEWGFVHPDAPTPIPRKSSTEELRAAGEPWVVALDEFEARMIRAIAERDTKHAALDARTSETDLEQEKKLADHEIRMRAIEANSGAAASGTATLVKALTGRVHPKVLGAIVVAGMLANFVLEVLRLVRGNR